MRLFFLTVSSAAVLVAGVAQADVIADRQAIMKDLGRSVGSIAPMVKGEKPFDAATALAALEKIDADARKLDVDTLFPAGSDQGDTEASPKIWKTRMTSSSMSINSRPMPQQHWQPSRRIWMR